MQKLMQIGRGTVSRRIKFQKSLGFRKIAEYDDPKRPKGVKNILFFKVFNEVSSNFTG